MLDTPVDYDELTKAGSMMGSGGMIVMDETTCMVDIARYFLNFLTGESCGKCTPCREGNQLMLEILNRICEGQGEHDDIEKLEEIAAMVQEASLCALGQTAPNPVLSTLKYFRDEYIAHIDEKRCPAGVCKGLISFNILSDKCQGCGICLRNCPVSAITGERQKVHVINQKLCTKCGTCIEVCPERFSAVAKFSADKPIETAGVR
jgi:NADH-quinone oxidoreductase subunit F